MRSRLRTLSRENSDRVARHLIMTGRLIDTDPELAYQHAQAAVRSAGRVDVVREAAGLAAYYTGRYAEALRELRTVRRLNGSSEHLAVMADCERGLGRPERAISLAREANGAGLDKEAQVELAMVVAGARMDMGDADSALVALDAPVVRSATGELGERVAQVRADALEAAGRLSEATSLRSGLEIENGDEVYVFDLEDEADADDADDFPEGGGADGAGTSGSPSAEPADGGPSTSEDDR